MCITIEARSGINCYRVKRVVGARGKDKTKIAPRGAETQEEKNRRKIKNTLDGGDVFGLLIKSLLMPWA